MTKKIFCQADLSGWLSPDEERLLQIYRDLPSERSEHLLYWLNRERFLANFLGDKYDVEKDQREPTTYEPELLEQLWLIRPEPFQAPDIFWDDPPAWNELMGVACPEGYDRVVLGTSETDGQNADSLFNGIHRIWDYIGRGPWSREPLSVTRIDCLRYLEEWRNNAMEWVFRRPDDSDAENW